jgi:hypothetical protein
MSISGLPNSNDCPRCGTPARKVHRETVEAMLAGGVAIVDPRVCEDPICTTLYFDIGWQSGAHEARVRPGFKHGAAPHLVCYCFGHSYEDVRADVAATGTSDIAERITLAMADQGCWCKTKNPTGRCCLAEVTRVIRGQPVSANGDPPGDEEGCCKAE